MFFALRCLRSAVGEFYFDLPRMLLLSLFWFVASLPLLLLAFVAFTVIRASPSAPLLIFAIQAAVALVITLALAGPATAAVYWVTNRLAKGELFEPLRFWPAFRRYFWRGWALALLDVSTGGLLALNVWFYWNADRPGIWLISIIFAYLLVLWFAIQSYLFALLIEMDQSLRLVLRNALFLAIDNPALTLGLAFANLLLLAISIPFGPLLLPCAAIVLGSNMNNKAVVQAIERYRATGRILARERS